MRCRIEGCIWRSGNAVGGTHCGSDDSPLGSSDSGWSSTPLSGIISAISAAGKNKHPLYSSATRLSPTGLSKPNTTVPTAAAMRPML